MAARTLRRAGATLMMALALGAGMPGGARAAEGAYVQVYRASGEAASMAAIASAMAEVDVVFLGEDHDDALGHQLEIELLKLAQARAGARQVILSLEMFERDVQPVLDEYLTGLIREKDFLAASRPWPNYERDYRPLVELARAAGFPVIAANAPGRYVSRVGRMGAGSLAALPQAARGWIAPLPLAGASGAYAEKFRRAMGAHGHGGQERLPQDLLEAQVLRDATMAHAIARHLQALPKSLVVHVNGRFHSDDRLGVPEQLAAMRPGTRMLVVTLATRESGPLRPADRASALDFVILRSPSADKPPAGERTPASPPAPPSAH